MDCYAALAMTAWGGTIRDLPHHPRDKPRPAARRLDDFFQKAVRFPAGIARPRIGPGAAFVVGGAGRLAFVVAFAAGLDDEIAEVAAKTVDRGFDRRVL